MNCTLMHKNVPVVDMSIKDRTAPTSSFVNMSINDSDLYYIAALRDVHDIRHVPPGVKTSGMNIDIVSLDDWCERPVKVSQKRP